MGRSEENPYRTGCKGRRGRCIVREAPRLYEEGGEHLGERSLDRRLEEADGEERRILQRECSTHGPHDQTSRPHQQDTRRSQESLGHRTTAWPSGKCLCGFDQQKCFVGCRPQDQRYAHANHEEHGCFWAGHERQEDDRHVGWRRQRVTRPRSTNGYPQTDES